MAPKQPKRLPRPGVDEYGRTGLHYAARDGNVARVEALLSTGADPRAADDNGWMPLHFAVQAFAPAACEALLQAGSPVNAQDVHGNTPLWRAVFDSRGRGEVIAVLRRHGADAGIANTSGVSPADLAARIANYDVKQLLGASDV